ncbi:MAG: phosphatidate cytidylyltransferase [Acidobacteriaceae bacterium]
MKRIITALVLIPLVLLLVFRAPLWAIALVCCLLALLAIHEYLHIVRHYGVEPFRWLTYVLTVAVFTAGYAGLESRNALWVPLALNLGAFAYLIAAMRRHSLREGLPAGAFSFFGLPYIALSLLTLVCIRDLYGGVFWIVVLFATVWGGDSVAMYVGKALGRHRLAPTISPKKTWEGSLGSIVGSLFFSLLALHFAGPILDAGSHLEHLKVHAVLQARVDHAGPSPEMWRFIIMVVLLNIAAQLGDLVESVIKRGADVKDSGSLLPGHGGILDRIDALLFAAPVLWYYLTIVRY